MITDLLVDQVCTFACLYFRVEKIIWCLTPSKSLESLNWWTVSRCVSLFHIVLKIDIWHSFLWSSWPLYRALLQMPHIPPIWWNNLLLVVWKLVVQVQLTFFQQFSSPISWMAMRLELSVIFLVACETLMRTSSICHIAWQTYMYPFS